MVLCLVLGFVSSSNVETDEDGNVKSSGGGMGTKIMEVFRYACES
jgi:hypothetical protein